MECFCCKNYFAGSGRVGRVVWSITEAPHRLISTLMRGVRSVRYVEYGLCDYCLDSWLVTLPLMEAHHPLLKAVVPQGCHYCGTVLVGGWAIAFPTYGAIACDGCLAKFDDVRQAVRAL